MVLYSELLAERRTQISKQVNILPKGGHNESKKQDFKKRREKREAEEKDIGYYRGKKTREILVKHK